MAEEADRDADDAAKERIPIIARHLLKRVQARKGHHEPGIGLDQAAPKVEQAWLQLVVGDQRLNQLELVQGDDEAVICPHAVELPEKTVESGVGVVGSEALFLWLVQAPGSLGVVQRQRQVVEQFAGAGDEAHALHIEIHYDCARAKARAQVVQDGGLAHTPVTIDHDGRLLPRPTPQLLQAS